MTGFAFDTWGRSWGTSWGGSWGQTTTPTQVIDVGPAERRRRREYEEKRKANERLRTQIRQAIEGPDAAIVIPALERVATQEVGALAERVDIGELVAQVELWRLVQAAAAAYAARERAIDEDDEEVLRWL